MSTSLKDRESRSTVIIGGIRSHIHADKGEVFARARAILKNSGDVVDGAAYKIFRRSVDARDKNRICFLYSVAVSAEFSDAELAALTAAGAVILNSAAPVFEFGNETMSGRPVVVGSGPCGLFAALVLAENGYRPILIERGGDISERSEKVELFNRTGILDPDTNIQFGAGGAGTFSDGKLVTRINDPVAGYVISRFHEFGARDEILYTAKPHIGTDYLRGIVSGILNRLTELGADVYFHTTLIGVKSSGGNVYSAVTNKGEIPCGALILAVGHSARDTYVSMIKTGLCIEPKPYSVGMRIEHHRTDIDRAMYGKFAGDPVLGHAEYALSHNTKQRGVYTFCMCPGGEVVAAASEAGGVVVNGMSRFARDGKNSNSAVVCSIFPEDYGNTPIGAIEFQRKIEKAAFVAGGEDYSAPAVTVGDFLNGRAMTEPYDVFPSYRRGKYKIVSPDSYLPAPVPGAIRDALYAFDRKIRGFASDGAVLTGAETRTSAPIRILRSKTERTALGYENLYPAGEGAGYAGGITSAATDGIHTAAALMKKYRAF